MLRHVYIGIRLFLCSFNIYKSWKDVSEQLCLYVACLLPDLCQHIVDAALLGQNVGREDPTGDEDGLSVGRWDYFDNGTGQASAPAGSLK